VEVGVRVFVGLGPGVTVSGIQGVIVMVALVSGDAVSVGGAVGISGAGVGESVAVPVGAITRARVGYNVGVGPPRLAGAQALRLSSPAARATKAITNGSARDLANPFARTKR
jgi:hypothetical protein